MSQNQMSVPAKGGPKIADRRQSVSQSLRFQTRNLYSVVEQAGDGDSDGSDPPTSSGGSVSVMDSSSVAKAIATPSRKEHNGGVHLGGHERADTGQNNKSAPLYMRRMTMGANTLRPVLESPTINRVRAGTEYSTGSPVKHGAVSKSNTAAPSGSSMSNIDSGRRDSMVSGHSADTPIRLTRSSTKSQPQGPSVNQARPAPTLPGISEFLVVQEMAYRNGQQDHDLPEGHWASNPFPSTFDQLWIEHYKRGKAAGGTPVTPYDFTPDGAFQQTPTWPVLTNAYTQDFMNPWGLVDPEYIRKICDMSLNAMRACIGIVVRRRGEWQKIICDVPKQVRHALEAFPDLLEQYEFLKNDAREALAGGLPMGYYR